MKPLQVVVSIFLLIVCLFLQPAESRCSFSEAVGPGKISTCTFWELRRRAERVCPISYAPAYARSLPNRGVGNEAKVLQTCCVTKQGCRCDDKQFHAIVCPRDPPPKP